MILTPDEQLFLLGEIVPEQAQWWLLLFFFDISVTASMLFAAVCLLGLVVGYFAHLSWAIRLMYSVISSVVRNLVLSPVYALVSGARLVLVSVRSRQDLQTALRYLRDWFIYRAMESHLYRSSSAAVGWFFPGDFLALVWRLFGVGIVGSRIAFAVFLVPVAGYLSGFSVGFWSKAEEQSAYCLTVLDWLTSRIRLSQRQSLELNYCIGEEAGLQVKAIVQDDWGFAHPDEIHHLYALAFVATVSAFVIAVALVKAAFIWRAERLLREQLLAETKLRDEIRRQQEVDQLRTTVDDYRILLTTKDGLVEAKNEELRVAKQMLERARTHIKAYDTDRNNAWKACSHLRNDSTKTIAELQHEIRKVVGAYNRITEKLRMAKEDTTVRERSLEAKVAMLERQLAQREQADDKTLSEISSLGAVLETRNQSLEVKTQQLKAIEHRLAAAEAREEESRRQLDTERQKSAAERQHLAAQCQGLTTERELLVAQVNELTVKVQEYSKEDQQATARYDELQSDFDELYNENFDNLMARDRAVQRAADLESELGAARAAADAKITELQGSLDLANQSLVGSQRTMDNLWASCDLSLAQERQATAEARSRAGQYFQQVAELEQRLGMAVRDAERCHKEAEEFKASAKDLERRLARYELPQGSSQEIPTRRTGNWVQIPHALEESRVTVAMQLAEIYQLKRQLEAERVGKPRPSDEAMEQIARLRKDLEGEKRARVEDRLRWDKRTRELEEENRKLRISKSNDAAVFNKRASRR